MEKKLTFIKEDFHGGLNRIDDTTKLAPNQYPLLVNARTRYNSVEPILRPLLQTSGLPSSGLFQGVYAAGSIVLVFIAGKAYFKDFNSAAVNYTEVVGLQMDATVEFIFVEFVAASGRNFSRKAGSAPNNAIELGNTISQSPQCAVVQDGVNQPWIINSDGTARESQNYNQWTTASREYVPIGQQMLYHNGVLYVVATDGSQIYRSVTGRPLDFVVAVDSTGDKVADAGTVSHAVDYGSITCIKSLNTDANAIFVGTSYRSYMVVPVLESTIYGEPTFNNIPLFTTGPLSQFAFIELLGDSAFVTFSGIRSFNAVLQLKREGKNAPFSSEVAPFLQDIIQNTVAAVNFDDFALFSVNTIHGSAVLVYDTLENKWTAVDKLTDIGNIKQFAEIKIPGTRKLFFVTASGLYEYYGNTTYESAGIYLGDYTSGNPSVQHKPEELHLVFSEPIQTGTVNAEIFTDSKKGGNYSKNIANSVVALTGTLAFPFGNSTQDRVRVAKFDLGREKTGWKLGAYVSWNFNAKLTHAEFASITQENTELQAQLWASSQSPPR